jgi:hypothetical protein
MDVHTTSRIGKSFTKNKSLVDKRGTRKFDTTYRYVIRHRILKNRRDALDGIEANIQLGKLLSEDSKKLSLFEEMMRVGAHIKDLTGAGDGKIVQLMDKRPKYQSAVFDVWTKVPKKVADDEKRKTLYKAISIEDSIIGKPHEDLIIKQESIKEPTPEPTPEPIPEPTPQPTPESSIIEPTDLTPEPTPLPTPESSIRDPTELTP